MGEKRESLVARGRIGPTRASSRTDLPPAGVRREMRKLWESQLQAFLFVMPAGLLLGWTPWLYPPRFPTSSFASPAEFIGLALAAVGIVVTLFVATTLSAGWAALEDSSSKEALAQLQVRTDLVMAAQAVIAGGLVAMVPSALASPAPVPAVIALVLGAFLCFSLVALSRQPERLVELRHDDVRRAEIERIRGFLVGEAAGPWPYAPNESRPFWRTISVPKFSGGMALAFLALAECALLVDKFRFRSAALASNYWVAAEMLTIFSVAYWAWSALLMFAWISTRREEVISGHRQATFWRWGLGLWLVGCAVVMWAVLRQNVPATAVVLALAMPGSVVAAALGFGRGRLGHAQLRKALIASLRAKEKDVRDKTRRPACSEPGVRRKRGPARGRSLQHTTFRASSARRRRERR